MKGILINYLIYFYTTYIVKDFDILKPYGKLLIYPFWFIKSFIFWLISPLFIFEYLIVSSNFYKNLKSDIEQIIG